MKKEKLSKNSAIEVAMCEVLKELKKARDVAGVSATEMAKAAGVSRYSIYNSGGMNLARANGWFNISALLFLKLLAKSGGSKREIQKKINRIIDAAKEDLG